MLVVTRTRWEYIQSLPSPQKMNHLDMLLSLKLLITTAFSFDVPTSRFSEQQQLQSSARESEFTILQYEYINR